MAYGLVLQALRRSPWPETPNGAAFGGKQAASQPVRFSGNAELGPPGGIASQLREPGDVGDAGAVLQAYRVAAQWAWQSESQRPNAVEFVAEQPLFPQVNLPGGAFGHISADERYLDMPYGA